MGTQNESTTGNPALTQPVRARDAEQKRSIRWLIGETNPVPNFAPGSRPSHITATNGTGVGVENGLRQAPVQAL